MKCLLVVGTMVLLSSSAICQSESPRSRIAGKQFMVARYTKIPPVIDAVFSLAEWGRQQLLAWKVDDAQCGWQGESSD